MAAKVDDSPRSTTVVAVQLALCVALVLFLRLRPPADGAMLLIPLKQGTAPAMIDVARSHHLAILAAGPLPMSLVVSGHRAGSLAPLLAAGILPLSADATGCGGSVS